MRGHRIWHPTFALYQCGRTTFVLSLSLSVSIPAMVIPHLLVAGVVEVIFTVAIFAFVKRMSPGMIYVGAKQKIKAVYGLLIPLICLTPLGLLATGTAWGEWEQMK